MNCCPSVLDTVGWIIWPVKIVPDMTYNVFGGTLNPTLLTTTTTTTTVDTDIIDRLWLIFFALYLIFKSDTLSTFVMSTQAIIGCCCHVSGVWLASYTLVVHEKNNYYFLHPGPSTRLVETRTCQHSQCWQVMETGHLSTRAVNSSSGNRALVVQARNDDDDTESMLREIVAHVIFCF